MKQDVSEVGDILRFRSICARNGLRIDDERLNLLQDYVGYLLEWNSRVNLISRKDTSEVWFSHILHSVSLLFYLDIPPLTRVLDLGTGGGLPGIPLSIVRPDLEFALLDSIRKKTGAVDDMTKRLQLGNVKVLTGRAEELFRKSKEDKFDIVVSRAVAPLVDLIRWSKPLLRRRSLSLGSRGGWATDLATPVLLTLKGGDLGDEVRKAGQRNTTLKMDTIPLVFEGSEDIGLEEKKMVLVHFRNL